ncbi:MAG TPA: winged helix-turn-helix domain-containing protein [Azospirillum sp.]
MDITVITGAAAAPVEAIRAALGGAGHAVKTATKTTMAARAAEAAAVVLAMSATESLDAIRTLRTTAATRQVGALVLPTGGVITSAASAQLLRAGADGIARSSADLPALLTALSRRMRPRIRNVRLAFGIEFLPGRGFLVDGEEIGLTATECAVVAALIKAGGRALRKRALHNEVYVGRPNSAPEGCKVLDVYVFKIRQKLGAAGVSGEAVLITDSVGDGGVGYRIALDNTSAASAAMAA